MLKRLISYLFHRYCQPSEIKTLYLEGIQRDFGSILSEKEARERNVIIHDFLETGWFDQVFNEVLKDYVESLFNICETQKQRDYMSDTIKALLKFERKFKSYGVESSNKENFDKYNI